MRRHSDSEKLQLLARAKSLEADGMLQAEIAKDLGISEMTFHRWRHDAIHSHPLAVTDDLAPLRAENVKLRAIAVDILPAIDAFENAAEFPLSPSA